MFTGVAFLIRMGHTIKNDHSSRETGMRCFRLTFLFLLLANDNSSDLKELVYGRKK